MITIGEGKGDVAVVAVVAVENGQSGQPLCQVNAVTTEPPRLNDFPLYL